jgi:hypothetical protein
MQTVPLQRYKSGARVWGPYGVWGSLRNTSSAEAVGHRAKMADQGNERVELRL